MKKFNSLKLGLTAGGIFLGAGYVSGQELWKFFAAFGTIGIPGRVISLAVQLIFTYIILWLGRNLENSSMDRLLIPDEKPLFRAVVSVIQMAFLFGVTVIMCAGAGALVNQLLRIPSAVGGILFCVIACLFAFKGIEGLSKICSVLVPCMVAVGVLISVWAISKQGINAVFSMEYKYTSPLIPNWWISLLTYVSYNMLAAIGVLPALGIAAADDRSLKRGNFISVVLLLVISLCIIGALGVRPDATSAELPMLALATELHPAVGWMYAALLVTGMMGTTVSFWLSASDFIIGKVPRLRNRTRLITTAIAAVAFAFSLLGFGDLVSTVYPVFGYLGFVFMALLVRTYFLTKKQIVKC